MHEQIAFLAPDGGVYLGFRGTDGSVVSPDWQRPVLTAALRAHGTPSLARDTETAAAVERVLGLVAAFLLPPGVVVREVDPYSGEIT